MKVQSLSQTINRMQETLASLKDRLINQKKTDDNSHDYENETKKDDLSEDN
ncbi:hypothetical protein KBB05_02785 [Patescibacteria group bacterium]|jgi:hypothetical protein|nr:hypothetical protein [Patescibacteria group bacterium]